MLYEFLTAYVYLACLIYDDGDHLLPRRSRRLMSVAFFLIMYWLYQPGMLYFAVAHFIFSVAHSASVSQQSWLLAFLEVGTGPIWS